MRVRQVAVLLAVDVWMLGVAVPAAAQPRRAAVVVEWEDGAEAEVSSSLGGALTALGYEVLDDDTVTAARAFVSPDAPLEESTAGELRRRLGVDPLYVVSVRPAEEEEFYLALERHGADGIRRDFGRAPAADVPSSVARRAAAWERDGGGDASPPISTGRDGDATGATPNSQPPPTDPPTPEPPAEGTTEHPAAGATSPAAANPPATSTGPAAAPPATPDTPPVPGDGATGAGVPATAEGSPPHSRADRARVVIAAFAGFEGYGYGAGVRYELPLARLLSGGDEALSLGFDLGLGFDRTRVDKQHYFNALAVPAAAYLTWRFVLGDAVELGPRVGVAALASFLWAEGPLVEGFRMNLTGYVLLGLTGAVFVGDEAQLFAGLDWLAGEHGTILVSAGVAL